MKKLTSIVIGWYYYLTNRNNKLALERLDSCKFCRYRKGLTCGICGCVLQAKARLESEECPHPDGSRWKQNEAPTGPVHL